MNQETNISGIARSTGLAAIFVLISTGVACTTAYDSSGRQVQSVDPGAAVAGAAAAGIIGYAIGRNNSDDNYRHYNKNDYYRSNSYYRRRTYGHYRR